MSYTMTQWQNGQEPAINAENLNKIERGIYDAHQTAEGKYSKPSLGIPKNDLAESVKNSLDNADSALQDADVDSALSLISTNPVQNKIITNKIAGTDRRLDMLYKLTQGQTWDFDRDNNNAYSVDVPSGAKYASVDMVGGGTVAWNQIMPNIPTHTQSGVTITNNGDGSYTLNGTATATQAFPSVRNFKVKTGHKYLFRGISGTGLGCLISSSSVTGSNVTPSATQTSDTIFTCVNSGDDTVDNVIVLVKVYEGVTYDNLIIRPQLHDLTAMFGSGNEPATVEEFEAMFPDDYYPYSEPTIISSQTDRVDVRGVNLWDEEWEVGSINSTTGQNTTASNLIRAKNYIPVFPDTAYFMKTPVSALVYYYDTNKNFIDTGLGGSVLSAYRFTTPSNCRFIRFRTSSGYGNTYKNDICINLSNPSRDGSYSPYSLQQITTGFPVLNSAGSVYDYIDIDNGKLHQRVGKAVFDGSEAWSTSKVGVFYLEKANLPNKKQGSSLFAMSNKYSYGGTAAGTGTVNNGSFAFYNNQYPQYGDEIYINDISLADTAALKASLASNPLTIIYELAEEIVTDITIPAELSDWLTVEAGGSITFHNADEGKRLLIPNTEEYLVKLSEVISNG